jgi:hypothetical protein
MAVNPQKYSIYAQKNLEKEYVDWGKVAQDVTKGITTIAAERAARKAAIDEETQKAMENLSAVPDVQNQDAGALIINASDMSKKNLQIQYDLLKRGLISPKDFQLYMQQQKNGYSSYSESIKNWDNWYQKSLERQELDANGNIIASEGELYNTTALESFGNLKNKVLMTNPANGQLQLVEMDKDGDGNFTIMPDVTKNPQRIINPHGINQRMNMRSNRKVLNDEAKKLVDPLGQVIQSYVSDKGTGFTKEGFRYADGKTYEDFLVDAENTLTATNDDQMQILTGVGYRIAQSEKEFKEKYPGVGTDKMILVSYDSGAPVYSLAKGDMEAEAKKVARAAVDRQVDDMTKTDREMSPSSKGDADALRLGRERIKTIGELYSSKDPEVVERAIKSLLSTSDDRFAEFDQVTVGEGDNAIVTEIIVPYIDNQGNKVSKPVKLHELKEGAEEGSTDPNDYVAVSPAEFSKGMYEIISMGDNRYLPFSRVSGSVDNDLIINPTNSRVYKPRTDEFVDPREAITISSTVGSGKDQTTVKEIYSKALGVITGAKAYINKPQVAALADSLNEAVRGAAVQRGDDAAANRVSITAEGADKIIVKVDGEVTQTISIPDATFDDRQETLEGEIDTIMNELLTTILPAIEGGYQGENVDPLGINE